MGDYMTVVSARPAPTWPTPRRSTTSRTSLRPIFPTATETAPPTSPTCRPHQPRLQPDHVPTNASSLPCLGAGVPDGGASGTGSRWRKGAGEATRRLGASCCRRRRLRSTKERRAASHAARTCSTGGALTFGLTPAPEMRTIWSFPLTATAKAPMERRAGRRASAGCRGVRATGHPACGG
jgi:hypothetical protein